MTTPPGIDPQLKEKLLGFIGEVQAQNATNNSFGRRAWTVTVPTASVVAAIKAQLQAMSTVDADVTAERLDAIGRRAFRLNLYLRFIAAMGVADLGLTLRDLVFFQVEIPEP